MKVIICAIAKNENKYINDWVKYHLNLGFDEIYVFDNNDLDAPDVSECIDDSVKDKVHFIDVRGKSKYQCIAYNSFYKNHKTEFDWCAFIDIDEFYNLGSYKNIKEYIESKNTRDFDCIYFNWNVFGDDEILEGDVSIPVYERIKVPHSCHKYDLAVKSMIKGNLDYDVEFNDEMLGHSPINLKRCMIANGEPYHVCKHIPRSLRNTEMCINHYMTKTLKEFLDTKMGLTDALFGEKYSRSLSYYFLVNKETPEKYEYIHNYLSMR